MLWTSPCTKRLHFYVILVDEIDPRVFLWDLPAWSDAQEESLR
jgi:hypothetical protein